MAKKNSIEWRLDRLERLLGYMQTRVDTVWHRTYARTRRRDDIERRVVNQAQALVKRLKDSRFLLAKKGQRGIMYLSLGEQQKLRQFLGRDKRRLTKKQRERMVGALGVINTIQPRMIHQAFGGPMEPAA